jgi:ABC-type glycerol-3-phosphate transport system substrate-binding protein
MAPIWKTRGSWMLLLALAGGLPGCVAAAAAAAGAGTGIYLTTRGAESTVKGSVDAVAARARAVLKAEGVTIDATSMEGGGDKREVKGTKGDLDIAVSMERESPTTTKTEVTARKNVAEWDKDYAQTILNKIVKSSAS